MVLTEPASKSSKLLVLDRLAITIIELKISYASWGKI